ncbi:MAG: dihydrofolate reductase [Lachnospiraceae bacterium]|jgi:dihydrofolate reductase|nr:dihydrofolate reductase [Lachnospiraceae bacterium]MCI1727323.1 dihydrofolate reductase [Lachnospiraceae bacterium]
MNCIAACDKNWGIGKNGKLLVSIPKDMAYFRKMTTGHTVIMGRKTLESLPKGRPLPDRINIVITRKKDYACEGALIAHSAEEAAECAAKIKDSDAFVIGGADIYKAMLPYVDTAYITKIDCAYDADAYFPNLDQDPEWEMESESEEDTFFDLIYTFAVYRRKK